MKPRVLIVGGGVIGSATAWFLARDGGHDVTVLERDPAYRQASSSLSASSIRQQFSQPVNIRLSQASLAFLRGVGTNLALDAERPDIALVERGYLYLATAAGMATLQVNHAVQCDHQVAVALRTHLDQHPAQQLDRLSDEHPEVDESIVLGAHERTERARPDVVELQHGFQHSIVTSAPRQCVSRAEATARDHVTARPESPGTGHGSGRTSDDRSVAHDREPCPGPSGRLAACRTRSSASSPATRPRSNVSAS